MVEVGHDNTNLKLWLQKLVEFEWTW